MTAALETLHGPPFVSAVARENNYPFRVLVATMISLRTKDAVTREASARLLAAARTPSALAGLPEARIAKLIYPAGFYHTKARSLRRTAGILVAHHAGRVPRTMEELLALPGVEERLPTSSSIWATGCPGSAWTRTCTASPTAWAG